MTDSQHRYINEDGTVTTLSLHHALRGIFIKLINKGSNIVRALSSRFDRWHLTASERYTRQNCAVVRTFVREYNRQRKKVKISRNSIVDKISSIIYLLMNTLVKMQSS